MDRLSGKGPAARRKKRTRGTVRVTMVFLALCAQLLLLAYFVDLLRQNAVYLYFFLEILGAVVAAFIITKDRNPSYTIFWLIIMLVLPVFGYLLFLLWGTTGLTHRKSKKFCENIARSRTFLKCVKGTGLLTRFYEARNKRLSPGPAIHPTWKTPWPLTGWWMNSCGKNILQVICHH